MRSLPERGRLTRKINRLVEQYNAQARPFVWVATAESILVKIERLVSISLGRYTSRGCLSLSMRR